MSDSAETVLQREQRARLGRLRWARLLARENGYRWTAYAAVVGGLNRASRLVQQRMARLEQRHGLHARTGRAVNYAYWQGWDWSLQGEEWTPSEEWKRALIEEVMLPNLEPGTTILEIGPGAGRWTVALQPIARRLILVDLSDRCIELCRQRFEGAGNMEFHVNDGRSLTAIDSGSVDAVWSFDVFVHIAPPDVDAYVAEINRVLRPGGRAVIHHARAGREDGAADFGQRSNMTGEQFAGMVAKHGLKLVDQRSSWGPDGQFRLTTKWDIISVIEK
jgi:cyclopropane fatty-acyl-phospholipid synthase-like methyltransferase